MKSKRVVYSKEQMIKITDGLDALEIGYTVVTIRVVTEKESFDPTPQRMGWIIEFEMENE